MKQSFPHLQLVNYNDEERDNVYSSPLFMKKVLLPLLRVALKKYQRLKMKLSNQVVQKSTQIRNLINNCLKKKINQKVHLLKEETIFWILNRRIALILSISLFLRKRKTNQNLLFLLKVKTHMLILTTILYLYLQNLNQRIHFLMQVSMSSRVVS